MNIFSMQFNIYFFVNDKKWTVERTNFQQKYTKMT